MNSYIGYRQAKVAMETLHPFPDLQPPFPASPPHKGRETTQSLTKVELRQHLPSVPLASLTSSLDGVPELLSPGKFKSLLRALWLCRVQRSKHTLPVLLFSFLSFPNIATHGAAKSLFKAAPSVLGTILSLEQAHGRKPGKLEGNRIPAKSTSNRAPVLTAWRPTGDNHPETGRIISPSRPETTKP